MGAVDDTSTVGGRGLAHRRSIALKWAWHHVTVDHAPFDSARESDILHDPKQHLLSTGRGVVVHPDCVLSKQVPTIVAGRWRDAQMIEILGAYTLLRLFSTIKTIPPGAKRPRAWLVLFLENVLPLQQ